MPVGMLRLINPPGHDWRRPYPGYAGGGGGAYGSGYYQRPAANPWTAPSSEPIRVGASTRGERKLAKKKRTAAPKVNPKVTPKVNPKVNPKVKRKAIAKRKRNTAAAKPRINPGRKTMVKRKKRTPPRYKSGPKKGQFMPKAARRRKKAKRNPITHVSATGKKTTVRQGRLSPKGRAAFYAMGGMRMAPTAENIAYLRRFEKKGKKKAKKATARKHGATTMAKKKTVRKPKFGTPAFHKKYAKKAAATRRRNAKAATVAQAGPQPRKKARKHGRRVIVTPKRRVPVWYKPTKRAKAIRRVLAVKTVKRSPSKRAKSGFRKGFKKLVVRRNPMSGMKDMLMHGGLIFGGLLGMRVLANALDTYVLNSTVNGVKTSRLGTIPTQVAAILPSAIGFLAAGFLAPKIVKHADALNSIQIGASLALFDAIFTKVVKPALNLTAGSTAALLLAGVDDMGVQGFRGYGGYNYGGFSGEYLPSRQQPLGLDVHEAMALDEYVPGGQAMGYDVSEALSDSEVDGMQRGFAAGSLAKTVFHT